MGNKKYRDLHRAEISEKKKLRWRLLKAKEMGFDTWEEYQKAKIALMEKKKQEKAEKPKPARLPKNSGSVKSTPWDSAGITEEEYRKWLKSIIGAII